jgi:uncharacterized protein (TIGR02266 family)
MTNQRRPPTEPEARAHERLSFEVAVGIVSDHNFYAGLSLNISEGGLFVSTHQRYPVGTRLEIQLLFPGDEEPTNLMTEVRWARGAGDTKEDAGAGLGLRFIDPPPEVMAKVARFAAKREPIYYED